jgi:hypothetical protein
MYSFKDYMTVDYTGSGDELLALAAMKRKRADADGTDESVDPEEDDVKLSKESKSISAAAKKSEAQRQSLIKKAARELNFKTKPTTAEKLVKKYDLFTSDAAAITKMAKELSTVQENEANEAIDKNHAIYKEYLDLKKLSIDDLRSIIKKQQKIVDVKDYTTKDHAASVIIRHRHGDKKVDAVFGFNENTSVNEKGVC